MKKKCSEELYRQGKAYPRTCAVCGLGPCRNVTDAEAASKPGVPSHLDPHMIRQAH